MKLKDWLRQYSKKFPLINMHQTLNFRDNPDVPWALKLYHGNYDSLYWKRRRPAHPRSGEKC